MALALAACALLYLPTLKAGFVYDDHWTIVRNPAIRAVTPLRFILDPQTFASAQSKLSIGNFRPVSVLSLSLDHAAWGMTSAFYHLENVLWHLLNGWLVLLLLRRFLAEPSALIGALVFLAHPVQVETVAWVTQRSNLLCTAGFLGAMLLLCGPGSPRRRAAGLALYGLALLAKEQALVLCAALFIHDWALIPKTLWRGRLPVYAGVVAVTALYGLGRMALGHPWALETVQTRLETNLYLAVLSFSLYLGKLIAPMNLRASYDYPVFDAWRIALAALVTLGYAAVTAAVARRNKLAGAALLWVPATLVTVLHLMPYQLYVAERLLYMAVIGVALGAGYLHQRFTASRRALYAWLVWLAITTAVTLPNWRDERSLWAHAVAVEPTNAFARTCYAESLSDLEEAERQYKKALVSGPSDGVRFAAVNNLSWLYLRRGETKRSLIWAQRAASLDPRHPTALFNLARAHAARGNKRAARRALDDLRAVAPPDSPMVRRLEEELR